MGLKKLEDFNLSLARLEESHKKTVSDKDGYNYPFFRDSSIQRFEFTVEIFWKLLKEILNEKDGIICNSPKSCVREFFSAGYIEEDNAKILLEMLDDRNLTSHTYHEEVAEIIFSKLGKYIDNLKFVSGIVKFGKQ